MISINMYVVNEQDLMKVNVECTCWAVQVRLVMALKRACATIINILHNCIYGNREHSRI